MKKQRYWLVAFVLFLAFLPFRAFAEPEIDNLVTNFYEDAKSSRSFAWTAPKDFENMVLRYAELSSNWESSFCEVRAGLHGTSTGVKGETLLHYKVSIKGLAPGTAYTYRIVDTKKGYESPAYFFVTEQKAEDCFSFITVTDMQGKSEEDYGVFATVLEKAIQDVPDAKFFLSLGDQVENANNPEQWQWFFDALSRYAPSLPVMATMGNHEARGDDNSAGYHFMLHFNHPKNADRAGFSSLPPITTINTRTKEMVGLLKNISGSFYSFDYGDVHFAVLNSGSDNFPEVCALPLLTAQKNWLEKDLQNSKAKWKIVLIHQGLYPACDWEYFGSRDVLEDVIIKCGVDLVLQGHDHIYMRSHPMKNGTAMTDKQTNAIQKGTAPVYLIPGSSGVKKYRYFFSPPEYVSVLSEVPQSTYTVVTVNRDALSVLTKDITGKVIDSFIIGEDIPAIPFTDVEKTDWFYEAVLFAYENSISGGVSETAFDPYGKVTRGAFMTMLCRAYGIPEMDGDNFSDCGESYYTGYLAAAKQLGISKGIGDNLFAPEAPISRQEMVTLFYN
ncbi:MAG: metallophosphoesterase, partial [Clostridia bacterium]|nr:metallophosphoesterase [Clostridia bacterium]